MTKKITIGLFVCTILLTVLALVSTFDNRLHLVFCDVGQGDGILIYRKSVQIVVDAGPGNAYLKCLSDHVPFWDRSIELVILTNPDRDHYGGMTEVFRRYQVKSFVSPGIDRDDASFEVLEQEVARERVGVSSLTVGQDIKVGELILQTLWPTTEWMAQETVPDPESKVLGAFAPRDDRSVNQTSLVFKLSYGEFDALLTGDVAPPASDEVAQFIARGINSANAVEVLKVPHHGSKNGLTQNMLDAVKPELAVISVGKNNRYHHPSPETLELLKNTKTLRTDLDGEVEIVTDGKSWRLR